MKKFLKAFLFVCACSLLGATVACDKKPSSDNSSSLTPVYTESSSSDSSSQEDVSVDSSLESSTESSSLEESDSSSLESSVADSSVEAPRHVVTFEKAEGYKILSDVLNGAEIPEGFQLTFKVDVGAFYTGSPLAYVNDTPVVPNENGEYSVTVENDVHIRVDGVRKDVSNMAGSGSMEDAFVVTKPIDLLFIAKQVNAGNRTYATGAYVLANDIDCKGEELDVIGDYSSQNAVFSGSFACVVDQNTGSIERHTISNFTINSENSNYVGLFGAVFTDMSVTSSGLFYGICLENYTINAGVAEINDENKTISCGSLVGYGVGANFYLCDAKNGTINVNADQNYFSFVGGLVGYQQAFYDTNYGMGFQSEISYSAIDVDVNIVGGVALYAGGISGYMATNYPYGATTSIHNSYSTGSVSGALRSGGIAGGLGQYTVVSNCYATGEITARSYQSASSPLITTTEYCYAYAGGIVGFGENDSIAHDSFFQGTLSVDAASGKDYEFKNGAIGGGYEAGYASVSAQKYQVVNCLENVDLGDDKYLTKNLGWATYNWDFFPDTLPTINYNAAENNVALSMTLKYVAPSATEDKSVILNDETEITHKYFDTSIQSLNSYRAIGDFMVGGGLAQYYEADNGYLSFGYFFDEACTQPVPVSYMPMKNVTLYIGFADPTPVVGTYYMFAEKSATPLTVTFNANGVVTYTDGTTMQTANYSFDGENILVEGARLARYYQGEIIVDEEDTTVVADTLFDMYRYDFYNFVGTLDEEGISLYDGIYFTKDAPLLSKKVALRGEYFTKDGEGTTYYTFYGDLAVVEKVTESDVSYAEYDGIAINGDTVTLTDSFGTYATLTLDKSSLSEYDAFKGTWVKSASVNKLYTFDGAGAWEYVHTAYERSVSGYYPVCDENVLASASGSYQITNEGTLVFTHDNVNYVASFNKDGFLVLNDGTTAQTFYGEQSFVGNWQGSGYELALYGIREDGVGVATLTTADRYISDLIYERSETKSVIAFYAPQEEDITVKGALYGYAYYDVATNTLRFTLPNENSESGYAADILYLYDDYYGEWVCDLPELNGVNFHFNGLGLYSYLGIADMSGSVTMTENGESTTAVYTLDSSLHGKFSYKGKTYEITYDEDLKKVVVSLGADTVFERKDELANVSFVDMNGVKYFFDGRSTLQNGGRLTVDEKTTYGYVATETGFAVLDAQDNEVGSVEKKSNHYLLTIGDTATELYIENEFMGDWAISNQYALFQIGPTDTNGKIQAVFKGSKVELSFLDPATLTFKYRDGKMPYTYYVFIIYDETTQENVLVFSEFTNLLSGEYFICSKVNELYGTWEWNRDNGKTSLRFDGVESGYINGFAELTLKLNTVEVVTDYFYMVRDGGIVMWSREPMAERTWYFRLDLVPEEEREEAAKEEDVFVLRDEQGNVLQVLRRAEVDGLYLTNAFDEKGTEYLFDGEGNMKVGDEVKYTYTIKSYNSDNTATLEVVDVATGIKYSATLDYKDSTHILFTLGEEIPKDEENEEANA